MTASDALISEHRTASALNGTDEQRLIDSGDIMIDPESRELRFVSTLLHFETHFHMHIRHTFWHALLNAFLHTF